MKKLLAILILLAALFVAGCDDDEEDTRSQAQDEARALGASFDPYIPKNAVEQTNYNKAQEIYDDPTTIQWCTVLSQSSTAPIVTFPVAGKLTSSSTTAFRPEEGIEIPGNDNGGVGSAASVDGLYHPNPPQYRYGFTPGDVYVDVANAPMFCTTKPLAFQTQSVEVKVDNSLNQATQEARQALENGDTQEAEAILEGAAGG